MSKFKIALYIIGSLLILASGKLSFELGGITSIIIAGYIGRSKQVIIRRIHEGRN